MQDCIFGTMHLGVADIAPCSVSKLALIERNLAETFSPSPTRFIFIG